MSVTRATIRSMIRQRADIEGDTVRFPDSELNQYINDSLKRFQAILLKKGLLKTSSVQTYTANGGTSYSLPTDFLAAQGVFYIDGDYHRRLMYMNEYERAIKSDAHEADATYYRIYEWQTGSTREKRIEFYPEPQSGTYKLVYVPIYTFSTDTDAMDDVLGWHEYVILDVAIKCLTKDDIDYSALAFERDQMMKAIEDESEAAVLNDTYVVQDVNRNRYIDAADHPDYIRYGIYYR